MPWISQSDHGSTSNPGDYYCKKFAGIKKAANGQYELHVRKITGSNQGHLEEYDRIERRYRSGTLEALLKIGIEETLRDKAFGTDSDFLAAIRDAIYDAQDAKTSEKNIPEDTIGFLESLYEILQRIDNKEVRCECLENDNVKYRDAIYVAMDVLAQVRES